MGRNFFAVARLVSLFRFWQANEGGGAPIYGHGGGRRLSPNSAIFLSVPFIMISAAGRFFYMLINFYAILHNLPT